MNTKKTWLIIGGLVLIIAAAITYVALSGGKVKSPQDTARANDLPAAQATPEQQQVQMAAQPGSYTAYNAEAFGKDTNKRVLFFHAPWCPQCRALEKSIQEGEVPAGVTIYKVDFDSSHDLRMKYGVTRQTTFVEVDANGQETNEFYAYYDTTLAAVIKGLKL